MSDFRALARTAASQYGLLTLDQQRAAGVTEIVTRYEHSPSVPGVTVHRSLNLRDGHTCVLDGIPVTTVPRTLIDAGAVLPVPILERQVERAVGRGLTTPAELRSLLNQLARRGRRGAGRLRQVLDERALGEGVTDSELEEMFARICRDHGLPLPEAQVWVRLDGRDRFIDFAYVELKVAIEIDGYESHSRRAVFEDDRDRQNALVAAGWTVIRFTYRMLLRQPSSVARALHAVL